MQLTAPLGAIDVVTDAIYLTGEAIIDHFIEAIDPLRQAIFRFFAMGRGDFQCLLLSHVLSLQMVERCFE